MIAVTMLMGWNTGRKAKAKMLRRKLSPAYGLNDAAQATLDRGTRSKCNQRSHILLVKRAEKACLDRSSLEGGCRTLVSFAP